MVLSAATSQLVIVDMQERLLPAMHDASRIADRTAVLLEAARTLDVPVVASEQYPKGLGRTVPQLAEVVPREDIIEKIDFSLAAAPGGLERIRRAGRDQVVIAGVEAHVCVLQTAAGLQREGFQVHIVADAVGSRDPENKRLALDRLRQDGATIVSTEMVVFEWLERAGSDAFRALSKLIR